MPSAIYYDYYSICTNMDWDNSKTAAEQLQGVTFGVQGLVEGDYTAVIHDGSGGDRGAILPIHNKFDIYPGDDGDQIGGSDSTGSQDYVTVEDPDTGESFGANLGKIYNVDKFVVTLQDGRVIDHNTLPAGLQVRTLENGFVWVDVPDTWLDANGDMAIASIAINRDAQFETVPYYSYDLYDGQPDPVVCFTIGTLIETDQGNKPVEELAVGDMICTMDDGYQPIRWIGSTRRDAVDLAHEPKLRPVRIRAGALGNGLPKRDLMVSRQHRVLVKSKIAQRMFGAEEILVPANKLVGLPGIGIADDIDDVTYFHILFDRHQVIFSEDAPTESLFTGPEALKSVPHEARKEIERLFPEITDPDFTTEPARVIPEKGMDIKKLIARHRKDDLPLQSG